MEFLMDLWSFFNNNIFAKPAFFIGIIVLAGYLLMKKPAYIAFAGFIKATVGYLILQVGSGGLVGNFRPILVGLNQRFQMSAAVIDPYYGQIAAENLIVEAGRSVSLGMSALILGWPLGLALCCWLYCPAAGQSRAAFSARKLIAALVRFMTAIPTVVYGFAAVFLLTPFVRAAFGGTGFCWLSAALMLAVLILPTIVLLLSAGIAPRLDRLLPGALALGFTRLDLIWLFVLPSAKKTLVSSFVLGFGRAVGDTLIPLMLAGNAPQIPHSYSSSLRTLTAHMAMVTSNEVGGAAYNSLFVAGALLLLVNVLVSLGVRRLENASRKESGRGRR